LLPERLDRISPDRTKKKPQEKVEPNQQIDREKDGDLVGGPSTLMGSCFTFFPFALGKNILFDSTCADL
jgi:hypothetical protein